MPANKITVTAPARLHMGFIDLSGSLGRHFGSIGIALNEICTRLTLSEGNIRTVTGPSAERAESYLAQLSEKLGVSDHLTIHLATAIPEHVGLGSGTQLALAIGSALNAYYSLGLSVRELAATLERGLRSGIGIGVFEQGGLVVDGGRGDKTITPPLLVNLPVPNDWRFILVFDHRGQGLHGEQELAAFAALPPFPQRAAEQLCYRLMMQGLPALAEGDIKQFGDFISHLQHTVGTHFAPAQGGVYASPEVAHVMAWLSDHNAVAVGQTSWGPTGFCAVDSTNQAEDLVKSAQAQFSAFTNLDFKIVSANNQNSSTRLQFS